MSDTYDKINTDNQIDTSVSIHPIGTDTIHIRLEELRGGVSYKDFSEKVGISESGVRKYFPPYLSMPSIDKAVKIADAFNVNLDWLARGDGDKYKNATQSSTYSIEPTSDRDLINENAQAAYLDWVQANNHSIKKEEFDEEYVLIPGYHLQVSAGHGSAIEGEQVKRYLAFRRKWLKYRNLNVSRLAVVFAKGDSMEPTIHSGDSILIDTSKNQVVDGSIFVLRLGDDLYAKRLQKNYDGSLTIISDNRADYQPQVVPADQLGSLAVIGKVVWIGHDVI